MLPIYMHLRLDPTDRSRWCLLLLLVCLAMPENRRCTLCVRNHNHKTAASHKFVSVDYAVATKLLADTPGGEGAFPWTSERGRCFKSGVFVLLLAPGNLPEEEDASFFSCSKAYQANSSHLLKYKHNLALKSSAAMAAASTPPSDAHTLSTRGTRSLTTTQNELDEAHHQLESKSAMVVELDTKLDETQSELVSTRGNLTEAHVELGEMHVKLDETQSELVSTRGNLTEAHVELVETHHQLKSNIAMVVELDIKLGDTQSELVSTRVNLTEARVELGEMRVKLDEALQAINSCEQALAAVQAEYTGFREKVERMLNDSGISWTDSLETGLKRGRQTILRLRGQVADLRVTGADVTWLRKKHGVNWAELVAEAMKRSPDLEAKLATCKEESKQLRRQLRDTKTRVENLTNDKADLRHKGCMEDLRMGNRLRDLVEEGEVNNRRLTEVQNERHGLVQEVAELTGELQALSEFVATAKAVDKADVEKANAAVEEEDPEYDDGGAGVESIDNSADGTDVPVFLKATMGKKRKRHGGAAVQYTTDVINQYVAITR